MREINKGHFTPSNPHKYIGNVKGIVFRSGWELEFFKWIDKTPTVIGWNSEEIIIPYVNLLSKTTHRYFPDVFARIIRNGKIIPTLIEIKPEQFATMPIRGKRQKQKTYMEALERYYTNGSKWLAAKQYCMEHGWEFLLLCKNVDTNSFEMKNNLMESCIYDTKLLLTS